MQCQSLDFLWFHIATGIIEIEDDITLIDLLHEKLLPPIWGYLMKTGKLLKLSLSLI